MRIIEWSEMMEIVFGGRGWMAMKRFMERRLDTREKCVAALYEVESLLQIAPEGQQVRLNAVYFGCDVRFDRECLPFVKRWIEAILRNG